MRIEIFFLFSSYFFIFTPLIIIVLLSQFIFSKLAISESFGFSICKTLDLLKSD